VIAVLLLTYNRLDYARRTLQAAAENLRASELLRVHIADDGSSQEYRDTLFAEAQALFGADVVTITNSERRGYGGSYNAASQVVHSLMADDGLAPLILPLEDDWVLTRPLDLDPLAAVLRDGTFGCIRLGYLGWTQALRGEFVWARDQAFLRLDPESPERHVCAGHPRLETVEWERAVGPWDEGLAAGATEFEWCGRRAAREGVAWPVELLSVRGDLFVHVGTEGLGELVPGAEAQEVTA